MSRQEGEPLRRDAAHCALAVGAPILLAAAAYGLWWLSDRAGDVGPFDRASFSWFFAFPVWLAGPVVAGYTWRRLSGREALAAAIAVGIVIGAVAAGLFWRSVAFPDCQPAHTPQEWVVPCRGHRLLGRPRLPAAVWLMR